MASTTVGSGAALLEAARALRPLIRAAAEEIESERCLPLHLVRALQEAGMFRMVMPRAWGGPEVDLVTQIRIVEELSIADGSVGWCVMIGADGGYFTAFLDEAVGRAMYPDLDLVTAAMTRPAGRAVPVDGGYRVSGRWSFLSGCQHATWAALNCTVRDHDGAEPPLNAAGLPETRMCFLALADGQIVDTWHTTGLRGSGSNDFVVDNLFVPAERTFNNLTSPLWNPGPLYRLRTIYVANGAGVPLGIARAAVDELVALAQHRANRFGTGLRDESYVQMAVGRADALVCAARSYVYDVMAEVWSALESGAELTPTQRARYRLCLEGSCQLCVEAVELMYHAAGGASLYATSPLDRHLRDIHTVNQHIANSPKVTETAGRMLLGLEPGLLGF